MPLSFSCIAYSVYLFAINFGDYTALLPGKWVSGFYLFEAIMVPPIEVRRALAYQPPG